MDIDSEYLIIGIIEVFVILLGGLIVLTFFNRRLKKRVELITAWLTKLKETTSVLAKEANAVGRAFYDDHLADEIRETQRLFEKVSPGKELGIHEGQEDASHAIALRHMFLQVERNAHPVRSDDPKLLQLTETLNKPVNDPHLNETAPGVLL